MTKRAISSMGRQDLIDLIQAKDAEIAALNARIVDLLADGIHLPGWWCTLPNAQGVACDTFNGEMKEPFTHCRHCDKEKPLTPSQPKART